MPLVAYTDPAWLIGPDGTADLTRAHIERTVYGPRIEMRFGVCRDGAYDLTGDAFLDVVTGADAVVIHRARITPDVIDALKPACRVVARQGVGIDNLNVDLLARHGVMGFNVPDYCVDEVSSHTVAMLLALERGLLRQDSLIREGRWSVHGGGVPRRTADLSVGIVGLGRIGRATARKLQPLYRGVLAHDPYVHDDLMRGYGVEPWPTLAALLADADAVVLHAPLDDTTHHLIDHASLRALRPGVLLVNTARGGLVRPEAVLDALRDGRLGGYASDVFTPENPLDHPVNREILTLPNTLVTAHRAFLSDVSERSQRLRVAEQIHRVLVSGLPPLFGRLA
ncbi:C-terminal binding protein [Streptomyces acidiscabies]|uniref:C-terminal binding protein n=1 Tax=Streptomyces acidiscabies TaxID=42234 RepID=UPI000960E977|nr:C-terminal binding protein [Streptomyces acidiscabies]GAV39915.1 (S)-sulfolactate dehydrogenase [Streptomyces acidiscabies]